MKYDKTYSKIVNELIKKSFPELKYLRIFVSEANERVSRKCSAVTYYFIWFSIVKASRKLRNFSDKESEGVFAHEMGHILRFESCNFFEKFWKGFRYFTSRKARTVEENACDKIAVERGYARGLSSFKLKKEKHRKYADCYLSGEQVKQYAREIGKW